MRRKLFVAARRQTAGFLPIQSAALCRDAATTISQRDFIIQPGVATTTEWLRRVTDQNEIYPNGVESIRGNGDATHVGVGNVLDD
jgi:hypothetical protein